MTAFNFRMTSGFWGRIKNGLPQRIQSWPLWPPLGMGPALSLLEPIELTLQKWKLFFGSPTLCSKPERGFTWTASIDCFSGSKKTLWFFMRIYPSSTVRPYHLGGTDPTPCSRVGHPGNYILPATVTGSGMDMWPNWREGDSALRNSFGKRESFCRELLREVRKMAWSSWLPSCCYNEESCQRMEWERVRLS